MDDRIVWLLQSCPLRLIIENLKYIINRKREVRIRDIIYPNQSDDIISRCGPPEAPRHR